MDWANGGSVKKYVILKTIFNNFSSNQITEVHREMIISIICVRLNFLWISIIIFFLTEVERDNTQFINVVYVHLNNYSHYLSETAQIQKTFSLYIQDTKMSQIKVAELNETHFTWYTNISYTRSNVWRQR
jgi:membrane-bound acyltransferase YfiQ involved in biofilm formation